MAQITSHPFGYDCETCNGVVFFDEGRQAWKHYDRRSICPELAVVAVELAKVPAIVSFDNVALVA